MSVYNHTAISVGAAANAATINTPLGTIDAAIGDLTTLNTTPKTSVVGALGVGTPGTTAQTVIGAINEINISVTAIEGGATVSDIRLKEWTEAEAYELTAVTYNADGVVTTATVKWPDGSAGTFTSVTINVPFAAIDAYTVSHTTATKTVTQALVTRDAAGAITVKPALTVA
jgi:hypothetical protein